MAQAEDGKIFLCCKYDPAGNVPGSYDDNVLYLSKESDTEMKACLQSTVNNPAEYAALWRNINRIPLFVLLVNETNNGTATNEDSATTEETNNDNMQNATIDKNCTGPNCTKTNDSRPLISALKRELQMAVLESSKQTNDLIKIELIILVVLIILIVIVLVMTIVLLMKLIKMEEDECCETGNDTPADECFAKGLAASPSVPQSLQSYM